MNKMETVEGANTDNNGNGGGAIDEAEKPGGESPAPSNEPPKKILVIDIG